MHISDQQTVSESIYTASVVGSGTMQHKKNIVMNEVYDMDDTD